MDLFNNTPVSEKNWLPQDGTVNYYGKILPFDSTNFYYKNLLETID